MSRYGQQLKRLVKEAAVEFENEDLADVLATMIEEANFDYDVYVELPQMMENILEGKSEDLNDELYGGE